MAGLDPLRLVGALALGAAALLAFTGCATAPLGPDKRTPERITGATGASARPGRAAAAGVGSRPDRPHLPDGARYRAEPPSVVRMTDLEPGAVDPQTVPARPVGDRIESPLPEAEIERLREKARNLPVDPMVQWVQPADPRQLVPQRAGPVAAGTAFDSIDIGDCCGSGASVPPDPELAAGPFHLVAVVNVAFEIYDKTGAVLQPATTFSSFFSGVPGCSGVFDPNVLYDEEADRFLLGIDAGGDRYCIAASATPDPLGAWYRTSFATGPSFFDYPQAGVGAEAIFIGANIFAGGAFLEGRVFAVDRTALYAGLAPTVVTWSTGANSTPQPMNLHGSAHGTWPAGGPHYILTETFDGATHSVWAWNDPFGANDFGKVPGGDLDLEAASGVTAGMPISAPQLGPSSIQANDWRGLDAEYRNGRLWMTNMIACNPGGGTVDCVRWAEIDPSVPVVVQAGVFSSAGDWRIFPDLAVDHCNDMAIGYTKTSTATYPAVWATGREAADSAGMVSGTETELKAGEITYRAFDSPPRRWGDYSGMTVDPDGSTFWYLGEYAKDTGDPDGRWGTWIGSLTVPACEPCGSLDLEETTPVTDTRSETACLYLRAGPYAVGSGGDVTFTAGRAVILENGVAIGGTFSAGSAP